MTKWRYHNGINIDIYSVKSQREESEKEERKGKGNERWKQQAEQNNLRIRKLCDIPLYSKKYFNIIFIWKSRAVVF